MRSLIAHGWESRNPPQPLLHFHSVAQRRNPLFVFAFVFLVVIPEGNLRFAFAFSSRLRAQLQPCRNIHNRKGALAPGVCLRKARALLQTILILTLTAPLAAQTNTALIKKVDDHYNHLHSLRTYFTEQYTGMGMNKTESGLLVLQKPGKMRWSYDDPIGKVFILDGKYAWFYTPGDAQAQRVPAKQLDDLRSPLRFLLGHTQLQKELNNLAVTPNGSNFRITGIPKGMEQRVKLLTLWVTPAGAIEKMRLEEVGGATTEFTFSKSEENVPVKSSDFIFHAPPGVTVVNGLPPI